jgi:hypothetical protein
MLIVGNIAFLTPDPGSVKSFFPDFGPRIQDLKPIFLRA